MPAVSPMSAAPTCDTEKNKKTETGPISFPEPAIPWEGNAGSGIIRDRHAYKKLYVARTAHALEINSSIRRREEAGI